MPYADVDILDNKLWIKVATEWNEKELIKAIPGSRYTKNSWWIPLTWSGCLQLRGTFKDRLIISEMLNIWAKKLRVNYVDPALALRSLLAPEESKLPGDWHKLYPFQQVAVNFMDVVNSGVLGDDMGCITGDSVISINRNGKGYQITIKALVLAYNQGFTWPNRCNYADGRTKVRGLSKDGTIKLLPLIGVKDTGKLPTICITLDSGHNITCTADHDIVTALRGKVHAEHLMIGEKILIDSIYVRKTVTQKENKSKVLPDGQRTDKDGYIRKHGICHHRETTGGVYDHILVAEEKYGIDITSDMHVHHINGIRHDNRPENLILLTNNAHSTYHGTQNRNNLPGVRPVSARVVSIKNAGTQSVYDLSIDDDAHTYIANGIIVGNTGKTIETLAYLSYLEQSDNPYPVIIICPNSLKNHWESRIHEWVPDAETYVVEGPARDKYDTIDFASTSEKAIVIVNYESMRTLSRQSGFGDIRLKRCKKCDPYGGDDIKAMSCQVHPKPLNDFGWRTVILDEAHRIKDPRSQQTRACWAICHEPTVQHVWALTGTPIEKSIEDLWSIMHAVYRAEYPVKSKFVERYGITSWNAFGGTEVVGLHPDHAEEFYSFFGPRFRRMQKDIVLPQLPPKVYTTRYVEMTATQRRMYGELEGSLMCRTPDGKLLIAASELGGRTRLAQLACATCKITNKENEDDPTTWTVELSEPSSKIDELVDVIRELGTRKAVVAAEHSKLIDLAEARLRNEGISCLKITGDVSNHDRNRALDALNNGYIQILLFTTKAGGVGLDMSAASCLIWLQHPWSMIEYLQAEDRVRRIGSERFQQIDIIHIVTTDTIEEDKLTTLSEKLARLDEITRDRQARLDAGLSDTLWDDEAILTIGSDLGR